ncbi:MAG TPA: hypothetical protein ENN28_04375 [Candidatus Uhrbacteria bacterium]|nr:hypothetical protein [Candidatus Uhrbacteria bacterium]
MKNYTLKQHFFIFLVILAAIFLSTSPYIVGYFLSGDDFFAGSNHLNSSDVNIYLSYIEQVKAGRYLVGNLFTSESQSFIFFTPLWLLLGLIGKLLNINSILLFHLARVIFGFLFLYFIFYYFLNLFFKKFFDKMIAFLLIIFSSGIGLFFKPPTKGLILDEEYVINYFPVDLIFPEANTFLSLAHSGLFILSLLFIVLVFYLFLKENKSKFYYIFIFGISLLLGFMHTYDSLVILAVLAVYFIVSFIFRDLELILEYKNYIIKYVCLALGFLPSFIYFYFIVRKEPALWGWIEQNIIYSPPFRNYLLGYGLLIFLSIITLFLFNKKENKFVYFLLCWVLTLLVLAYIPLNFQRKLINSCHLGLAILASYGFIFLIRNVFKIFGHNYKSILITIIFFIFLSLSSLSFVVTLIWNYQNQREYFYFPQAYYQAVLWLKQYSGQNEAILAEVTNGNFLPAISSRPVYLGHRHQTINCNDKNRLLGDWFFQNNNQDQVKADFLHKYNINYIFYTDRERFLGDYNLEEADYLEKVFFNKEVNIYKVK